MGFGALQPSWSTAEAQHRDSCRTPPLPCWDPHPEPTCAKPPGDCVPPGYGWGWAVCESTAQPRRLLSAIKLCLQGRKPLPFPQSTKSLSYSSDISFNAPWELPLSLLHGNCLHPSSMDRSPLHSFLEGVSAPGMLLGIRRDGCSQSRR